MLCFLETGVLRGRGGGAGLELLRSSTSLHGWASGRELHPTVERLAQTRLVRSQSGGDGGLWGCYAVALLAGAWAEETVVSLPPVGPPSEALSPPPWPGPALTILDSAAPAQPPRSPSSAPASTASRPPARPRLSTQRSRPDADEGARGSLAQSTRPGGGPRPRMPLMIGRGSICHAGAF